MIGNLLFETDDKLTIGHSCVVNIGPCQYLKGVFHSYNAEEYCFKDCTYHQDEGRGLIPWTQHHYKPIHWVPKTSPVWSKCTVLEN